jgi:hypothetical protein
VFGLAVAGNTTSGGFGAGFDWAAVVAAVITGLLAAWGGTYLGSRLSIRQSKSERIYEVKREQYSFLLSQLEAMANAQTTTSILLQIDPPKLVNKEYLSALSVAAGGLPTSSPGGRRYNEFMRGPKAQRPTKSELENLHRLLLMEALFEFGKTNEEIRGPIRQLSLVGVKISESPEMLKLDRLLGTRADKLGKLIKHLTDGKALATFKHDSPDLAQWGEEVVDGLTALTALLASDLDGTLD